MGAPEDNNNVADADEVGRFSIAPVIQKKPRKVSVVTFVDGERKTSTFNWDPQTHHEDGKSTDKMSLQRSTSQKSHQRSANIQQTHQKSLKHYLTRERVPSETNYRLTVKGVRPTLEELMNYPNLSNQTSVSEDDRDKVNEKKAIKFGWFEGVYLRCLLGIWGVMLFLRLTWVVGQCGMLEGFGVIILANIVTGITTVSMSAVSTNGQIGAGGVYYMISRSLGPGFGGAIGLMFTVANSIGVSMYIVGFCESFRDMMFQYVDGFDGFIGGQYSDIRLIGSVTLVVLLAVTLVGMEWITRLQKLLLVLLIAAQVDFMVGTFLPPTTEERSKGFVGWNTTVAYDNLWSDYRPDHNGQKQSFFKVFAVFFPAVTGIMAGANMSGDLENPGEAIPKGTLAAIGTTLVSYIVYLVTTGFTTIRYASGVELEVYFNQTESEYNSSYLEAHNITRAYDDCLAEDGSVIKHCNFGTVGSQQMMEIVSAWGPLIYAGCFAATLSSAISSLEGAPRVLQALAKDEIFPYLETFAVGHGRNNDPIRGYIAVFAISLVCILIGDLNYISGLLANFFVAAYALINFSVFHASVTNSPGWRPSFKYYNKWLSILGTLLCITVMFLMEPYTALITFIMIIILYICVVYRKTNANWGSSTQAQSFVTALKASQGLIKVDDHIKNYRPKILVLSGDPSHRPNLVDFGNLITKKISLMSTLHIVDHDKGDWKQLEAIKHQSQQWLTENKIKAFHGITRSNSFSEGVRSALELHGLSKLSPNMILVGFKENWHQNPLETQDYYQALHIAMDMRLAVGILRLPAKYRHNIENSRMVDAQTSDLQKGGVSNIAASFDSGLDVANDEVDVNVSPSASPIRNTSLEYEEVYRVGEVFPDKKVLLDLPFRTKKLEAGGTIDIYWLYDDGGLTLLVPHILHTRKMYSNCRMRLFFLCSKIEHLDTETRAMIGLLAKFRIEAEDVIIISDATQKPTEASLREFTSVMESFTSQDDVSDIHGVTEEDLVTHREKTNFYIRISEVIKDFSSEATLIVMTLPVIRMGQVPAGLYLGWLDMMTRDMPPTLIIRGNQESVLTFYS